MPVMVTDFGHHFHLLLGHHFHLLLGLQLGCHLPAALPPLPRLLRRRMPYTPRMLYVLLIRLLHVRLIPLLRLAACTLTGTVAVILWIFVLPKINYCYSWL